MRVRVEQLIDPSRVPPGARPPTPREVREALPRGWVLEADGLHARRDARMLFREGWVLALGLVCFGAAAIGFFWWSAPRGTTGFARFAAVIALVAVAGGVVAPLVTRALNRR